MWCVMLVSVIVFLCENCIVDLLFLVGVIDLIG